MPLIPLKTSLPRPPVTYGGHLRYADTELRGKLFEHVVRSKLFQTYNLLVCELRFVVVAALALSAFVVSVFHVCLGSAKKQMLRVNASRVVASMADQHSVRDFAIVDHPCHSRRSDMTASGMNLTTTIFIQPTSPQVTSLGDLDFGKKSFFDAHATSRSILNYIINLASCQGRMLCR